VAALIAKAALIAPFAALILNIGPPWPAKTAVPALTALCEVFVLIYIFQFFTRLSRKKLDNRLRLFFVLLVVSFVTYIVLYSFFVFDITLTNERDVKGFIVLPAIASQIARGGTTEALLSGAEWDPFAIWEGWTIYSTRVGLLLSWILFFVGIAGCMAVFVTAQRSARRRVVERSAQAETAR
jgi:hypothetical protein